MSTFAALPPPIPGFEHLSRFWDPIQRSGLVKLLPGELYASDRDEWITTILGSCVAVCIHDPQRQVGGMNHFLLPEPHGEAEKWDASCGRSARYGIDAMEHLVNALLKAGGRRESFEIKAFGGGQVLMARTRVGQNNIAFVRRYLAQEGWSLAAEDLGGPAGRQVQFHPRSGRVRVRVLTGTTRQTLAQGDRRYLDRLVHDPVRGEVEMF